MNALTITAEKLAEICSQHDVAMLGIFGSAARGEADGSSDIDLLVKFSQKKGLLALVRLERILSEILGRKVELLTEAGLSPYIRDAALRDLQVLYGAR